jgi:bacteriocin biosynthesis cyclodehydratase domain-containing protein
MSPDDHPARALEELQDPTAGVDLLDEALVLNPHLKVVPCGKDEVLVKHGTRSPYSEVLQDEARTGVLGRVVTALAAPASLADLLERGVLTSDDVPLARELAEHLLDRRVLVKPSSDLTRLYLETIFARGSPSERIAEATIGVVGSGPLATRIASELAAFAPKRMVHSDPRSASAAETLADVCAQSDFVVLASETYSPVLLHATNEQAIEHATPWMSVYFDGSEAVVGPTYVLGETCCYHEFETQAQASLRYGGEHVVYKEFLRDLDPGGGFVLPAYAMIAAGWAVTSALRFLLEGTTFTVGRALHLNFETLSIDVQDVLKLPRCPACGGERPAYRNLFL